MILSWTLRKVASLLIVVITSIFGTNSNSVALGQNSNAAQAKSASAKADEFYRIDQVQSIYLRVSDGEMQRMLAALPERIYGRASFRWRDISLDNVAIRFKGNSSSAPSQQHKRSFLIKFDEYAAISRTPPGCP
jgi:hypothetical protein